MNNQLPSQMLTGARYSVPTLKDMADYLDDRALLELSHARAFKGGSFAAQRNQARALAFREIAEMLRHTVITGVANTPLVIEESTEFRSVKRDTPTETASLAGPTGSTSAAAAQRLPEAPQGMAVANDQGEGTTPGSLVGNDPGGVNLPHGITMHEIQELLKSPDALRALADYHSVKETEADAFMGDANDPCVKHHESKRKFYTELADKIQAEWER